MWLFICRCTFLVLLLTHQTKANEIPFDAVVSFGDSNTDTGNVYNLTSHTWPIVPPYFQGRFSNGPVWIENLGIKNIKNYAYGSATTDSDFIQGSTASGTKPVPGVRQQIKIYLNETNILNVKFQRTLYIVWAGGNDYYFNQTVTAAPVTTSLLNNIKDLLNIGAKHILIINQSPSEKYPYVHTQEQITYKRERNIQHNNNLSVGVSKLDYDRKQVFIYLFDMYSFILNILDDKNSSLNVKDNCWNVVTGNVTILCSNPESYVFIDQYHFSTRIHQLIGTAVRQFLFTSSGSVQLSYSIGMILSIQLFLMWSFHDHEKFILSFV